VLDTQSNSGDDSASDSYSSFDTIKSAKSTHGLAGRPSNNPGGRPKGLITRISGVQILRAINERAGKDFATLLAEGYVDAIDRMDYKTRLEYERVILSKVVADKVEVTMVEDRVSDIIRNLQQETIDADFREVQPPSITRGTDSA
jgi:hypothetical protein